MLETTRERAQERARPKATRQASIARDELGEVAVETLDGYFPEQTKHRRRREMVRAFLGGAVVGLLLRELLRR